MKHYVLSARRCLIHHANTIQHSCIISHTYLLHIILVYMNVYHDLIVYIYIYNQQSEIWNLIIKNITEAELNAVFHQFIYLLYYHQVYVYDYIPISFIHMFCCHAATAFICDSPYIVKSMSSQTIQCAITYCCIYQS